MNAPRTIGSLFSGIGGLDLGLERALGARTVWQVESDPYCRAVLAKHWPDAERFDDVRTAGQASLAPVDLICGGFPCQDISGAGTGAGLAGARSGLWYEYARLVDELRPEWVVVENVASGASRWVDAVRAHLGQLGYDSLPIPLGAVDVGAPHRRDRIFLVAHANGEHLRQQSRGGDGQERQSETQPVIDGESRPMADAASDGRAERQSEPIGLLGEANQPGTGDAERSGAAPRTLGNADGLWEQQPQGVITDKRRWAWDAGRWPAEPDVGRISHGVPGRAHRLRALGNAVVPQCAQVVGEVINVLCGCA